MAVPIGTIHTGAPADLKAVADAGGGARGDAGRGRSPAVDERGARARPPSRRSRSPTRSARSCAVPVELQDERLSTVEAERGLRDAGVTGRERRKRGRSDGGDRHPPGLARRARADGDRSSARRAGYPASPWSRDNLAGRTGMTIRAAAPGVARSSPCWSLPAARGRRGRGGRLLRPLQGSERPEATTWRSPWSPGRRGRRSSRSCTTSGSCGATGSWGGSCCAAPGKADAIRAGSYTLTTNMTFDEALLVLSTPPPPVPTARLTIPEGYRLTQIAERVHEALGIPQDRFLTRGPGHGLVARSLPPDGQGDRGVPVPRDVPVREGRRRRRTSSSACWISSTRRPKGSTGRTRRTSVYPTTRSS